MIVRLGDVYRDANGGLWEVIGLCEEPTATVRKVDDDSGARVDHVIGSPHWLAKFPNGKAVTPQDENG